MWHPIPFSAFYSTEGVTKLGPTQRHAYWEGRLTGVIWEAANPIELKDSKYPWGFPSSSFLSLINEFNSISWIICHAKCLVSNTMGNVMTFNHRALCCLCGAQAQWDKTSPPQSLWGAQGLEQVGLQQCQAGSWFFWGDQFFTLSIPPIGKEEGKEKGRVGRRKEPSETFRREGAREGGGKTQGKKIVSEATFQFHSFSLKIS